MGGMTDEALEGLEARNFARLNMLTAQGASVSASNPQSDRYTLLLLEALVGAGVARRCREEAAEWFAAQLTEAEEAIAKALRERALLAGNGKAPT